MTDAIIGFLRARVKEDEEYARNLLAYPPLNVSGVRGLAERLLAEADAKRAMVDQCAEWLTYGPVGPTEVDRAGDGAFVDAATAILRLLALPYRDFSDYREEWKP